MILATAWFLITLTGLGVFPALLLFGKGEHLVLFTKDELLRSFVLFLMMGLLTDHAVGLLGGDLGLQAAFAWVGLAGSALMIALIVYAARQLRTTAAPANTSRLVVRIAVYILIAVIFISIALAIFGVPLVDWDARSIWFFHAKVIFFDNGLHPSAFWNNAEYDWSHKDYPTLIPMLAARYAAFILDNWNEYAPKGALVPIACAGLVGLLAISRTTLERVLVIVSAVTILDLQLWDGYMDGWLALQGCVAVGALTRWACDGDGRNLVLGCTALGVVLVLKNEGQLVFAVALLPLLYGFYRHRRALRLHALAISFVMIPFLLWMWRKPQLPAHGDLEGTDLIKRATGVLTDGHELIYRLSYLTHAAAETTVLFQVLAVYVVLGLCVGFRKSTGLIGGTALLYVLGLTAVYLGTPKDFVWHVSTSLTRVVLLPNLLLLIAIFSMTQQALCAALNLRKMNVAAGEAAP